MAARSRTRSEDVGAPAPRSDAYTGLLILSFLALVVGAVFFYLDYSQYPESKPKPAPQITSPPPGGGPAPVPVPQPKAGGGAAGMMGGAAPAGMMGAQPK